MVRAETRWRRLGGTMLAFSFQGAALLLGGARYAPDARVFLSLAIPLSLAVVALGVFFGSRIARILAGIFFALLGIASVVQFIGTWIQTLSTFEWGLSHLLMHANALATTTLFVWLSYRAVRCLRGDARPDTSTARITGGGLLLIAVSHLYFASQMDVSAAASWSISASPSGTNLFGFIGWPLWHGALALVSAALLAAPRHLLRHAALALALLWAILSPLALVTAARSPGGVELVALAAGPLIVAYLCRWLADELRSLPSALPPSSGVMNS